MLDQLYDSLDQLPAGERRQLLRELLPPQELFARMDGTRFLVRRRGLGMFETRTLLSEAGIPDGDARQQVFRYLRGGLINRSIPDQLRSIAARADTICRQSGAVAVWDAGRRAWWVPLAATGCFEQAIRDLQREFLQARDRLLIDSYPVVRNEAEARWQRSAQAAWENLDHLGQAPAGREVFLQANLAAFASLFPDQEKIQTGMTLDLLPVQRPLPEKVEQILLDLRHAERQRLEAEADAQRAQQRLHSLEAQLRQTELEALQDQRARRDRLLREALDTEIEQAQQVVLQAQAGLMRVAGEIFRAVREGGAVSAATRRSWNRRLELLSMFAAGQVPLEEALGQLKQLNQDHQQGQGVDRTALALAGEQVEEAFRSLEKQAALELHADRIWQLLQAGKAGDALQRIAALRARTSSRLEEVEALWTLVAGVAAENELLAAAEDRGAVQEAAGLPLEEALMEEMAHG